MDMNTYWLLDSVIDSTKPLCWLHPDYGDLSIALNRPHHRMSFDYLSTRLYTLFEEDYLFIYDATTQPDTARIPLCFASTMIEACLTWSSHVSLQYGVTQKGGALWEKIAHPRWEHFSVIHGSSLIEIIAGNEKVTRQLFALYPDVFGAAVREPITWDTLYPWEATYWKQLTAGYRVQFTSTHIPREAPPDRRDRERWDATWHTLTTWYTPYNHE